MEKTLEVTKQDLVEALEQFSRTLNSADILIDGRLIAVEFWTKEEHVRFFQEEITPANSTELNGYLQEAINHDAGVFFASTDIETPFKTNESDAIFKTATDFANDIFPRGVEAAEFKLQQFSIRPGQEDTIDLSRWRTATFTEDYSAEGVAHKITAHEDSVPAGVSSFRVQKIQDALLKLTGDKELTFFYDKTPEYLVRRSEMNYHVQNLNNGIISSGSEKALAHVLAMKEGTIVAKDLEGWEHPLTTDKLKDALLRIEGLPAGSLKGQLDQTVSRYRINKTGEFEYVLSGQEQVQAFTLQKANHMSLETKSRMLDIAGGTLKPIQQSRGLTL